MKTLSLPARVGVRVATSACLAATLAGLCLQPLAADRFPVDFTTNADGQVSAAVYDADGRLIRSLLHGDPLSAGSYTIDWDGLDRHGAPVAPGAYTWKMLRTPGFTAEFVGHLGVNPPGNPHDFWIGSHGGVGAVTVAPDGSVFLGSDGAEGVPEMFKLDASGQTVAMWGQLSNSETSEDLEPGNSGHILNLGSDLYLRVLNASTGAVLYTVDVLPAGWNREAGKNRALDHDVQLGSSAAVNGDSVFVLSYPAGDMLRWYNYQTGSLITQVGLTGARGVAVGPSGNTYVISGGAIYRIVYSGGSTSAPTLVVPSSGLSNPFKIAYDHTNDELLVAEGEGSHQIKRFDLSGTLLATYGATAGGRAYGDFDTTARDSFRNITDLNGDGAGGFWVAEGYFTLRRLTHWDASGNFTKQHFGPIGYYPGSVMDPDHNDRFYLPIGPDDLCLVELDDSTHEWSLLKIYKWGASVEGRLISLLDGLVHNGLHSYATHWKIQKRNGQKYLVGESTPGVSILRIDEANDRIVPVAVAGKYIPGTFVSKPDEAPEPWDTARAALGYTLSNTPEFFTWCDLNDNGEAEPGEFLFTNNSVKTVGKCFIDDDWNIYFAHFKPLGQSKTLLRRMDNTSADPDHPVWNWSTHTQLSSFDLPADFTAAEIGEFSSQHLYAENDGTIYGLFLGRLAENFGRYGREFVNDDQGLARILKWSPSGDLLWEIGTEAPDSGFGGEVPTYPGTFQQPVLILGKIDGNLVVQDRLTNPGQVWSADGLYAGNLLDHRTADGLPDTVYSWFLDANGNDALIQSDCFVGSIHKTAAGDVYWMANGRQAPVVYKITGWDGWQTASGVITVAAEPASASLAGDGLQGEYFNNPALEDTPALTRTDSSLWFDDALSGGHITATWGASAPDAAVTNTSFSARWTGFIEAPLGEDFSLITETETGSKIRLWVDGQLVIDDWDPDTTPIHGGISNTRVRRRGTVTFNPGQLYAIRLEYSRGPAPAEVHLYWESASLERLHIPMEYLHAADPLDEIIVDNTDGSSSVTLNGSWAPSASVSGYLGTNYLYAQGAVPGNRSVVFKPDVSSAGNYAAYLRWTANANRSANVPVLVTHAGGSSTVYVDQTGQNGQWVYLGTWPFAAGRSGTVTVSNEAVGIVVADGVRLVRDYPAAVDAGTDQFVGWPGDTATLSGSASDPVGSGTLTYAWSVLNAPAGAGASFTSAATATTGVTVDAPGAYDFLLTVSDGTTSSSDVVSVLFFDELIVDNQDQDRVTLVGSWGTGISGSYYGSNYRHDNNAAKGSKTATYNPRIPITATYTVHLQWSANTNRSDAVPVTINHDGGSTTVHVNQKINGGVWNSLGAYTFSQGSPASVVIGTAGTSGIVVADAIRLTP